MKEADVLLVWQVPLKHEYRLPEPVYAGVWMPIRWRVKERMAFQVTDAIAEDLGSLAVL